MDGARSRRPKSSPPQLPFNLSDSHANLEFAHDAPEPAESPSRQQKLLTSRNARFPAKKLSISGLSNKLTQFIGNNEPIIESNASTKDQENNRLHKSRSTGTIGKRSSLGILEEISNTVSERSIRRRPAIPIYQDNPERPLLQSSPFASSPYLDSTTAFGSPVAFDHIHDSLNNMRLTNLAFAETWSPANLPPASLRTGSRKRPVPPHFDADEYIEHIEQELQQTRDEAYSPLTRRPMKEKLKAANKENERLQKELSQLREKFETEVKRTVEHKTVAELELKRKVKELEDTVDKKDHEVRELQYQYEERRLENNIISSLKANIDRLEQDKSDLEAINLSMSKRNEVLTQLLAMSPTKTSTDFVLGSPVREKRNARPISLILPRQPLSPGGSQDAIPHPISCSARALNSAEISPFKLSPDSEYAVPASRSPQKPLTTPQQEVSDPMGKPQSPALRNMSRRSTLFSDISVSSSNGHGVAALINDDAGPSRRKARRFMGGSTQLKPLLLPAITGESTSMLSASTASSPRSWPTRAPSEVDMDETVLANEESRLVNNVLTLPESANTALEAQEISNQEGPGPALHTQHKTMSNTGGSRSENELSASNFDKSTDDSTILPTQTLATTDTEDEKLAKDSAIVELSTEHLRQHDSQYSLQTMPMPSTPESLVSLPEPLFSPQREAVAKYANFDHVAASVSPFTAPDDPWQVNVRKKRKHSLGATNIYLPASKIHCRRQRRHSSAETGAPLIGRLHVRTVASSIASAERQMRYMRSSDNVADLLRQKNFAARPLAAMTIKTIYTLLSTCTSGVRDFRRDPFALARRVLANAWRMNWKMFGKVSWWVLGLFIQPHSATKAKAPIDWDQYDGESIASKYCSSVSDFEDGGSESFELENQGVNATSHTTLKIQGAADSETQTDRPGWGHSMYLWGKFSAALMLAVGGAVIKGPSEMLKETTANGEKARKARPYIKRAHPRKDAARTPGDESEMVKSAIGSQLTYPSRQESGTVCGNWRLASFDFRSSMGSSLLEQIQEPDYDSTLRAEGSSRGQLGSLFTPTPTSQELAARMEKLQLSSSSSQTQVMNRQDR